MGRQALALGALVLAAGLVLIRLDAGGSMLALVPAFLVDGAGMGIVMATLAATVLDGMDARHAGSAAGVLSSVQQVGNAIGVAIIGIVFYGPGPDVVHGFEACTPYLVGFAAAVAVLVQLLPRRQ
jgi:predicted MFS family arabinose efflux permease